MKLPKQELEKSNAISVMPPTKQSGGGLGHLRNFFGVVTFLFCAYFFSSRLSTPEEAKLLPTPLKNIPSTWLQLFSLGHNHVVEDGIFFWQLAHIFAEQKKDPLPLTYIQEETSAFSKHNPNLFSFYLYSCFSLAFDYHKPELCEPFLAKGMRLFPKDFLLPLIQGYLLAYPMHQPLRGAIYYHLASQKPDAPVFLRRLAKKLMSGKDGDPVIEENLFRDLFPREPTVP